MCNISVAACPALTLSGGRVSYTKLSVHGQYRAGTKGTYSCSSGYSRTSGWRVRTCQMTGKWTGSPAVCTRSNDHVILMLIYFI